MPMRCFECPKDLWDEARSKISQTKYGSMSEALRAKVREIAEIEISEKEKGILEMVNLSDKQKKVAKLLFNEHISNESISHVVSKIKREGIYNRDDYVKKALRKISRIDLIPFKMEGDDIVTQNIICSCGAKTQASILEKSNGNCPKCGRNLIDLSRKGVELGVVDE